MLTNSFAPAKVNLSLHVTGQRDDGYHLLDSLVVFVDAGDRISFTPQEHTSLTVTGPYSEGVPVDESNLVWKAAGLCDLSGAITLEKNLPNAAGIGGGSSDAAAMIRIAAGFDRFPKQPPALLGADVPVCLSNTPQRMQGTGEILSPVSGLPALWMVLLNPGIKVPTPQIFSALQNKANAPMAEKLPPWADFNDFCMWLDKQRNDLQAPAIALNPQIGKAIDLLYDARIARMSGSGATCFGLYETQDAARNALSRLNKAVPDWWIKLAKVTV